MAMQLAGGAIRRALGRRAAAHASCQCGLLVALIRQPSGRRRVAESAAAAAAVVAAAQVTFGAPLLASEARASSSLTSAEKRGAAASLQLGWYSNHCSIWRGDGTPATFEELVASAVESDVVLIGEEHDDRVTHALQLDLLSALNSRLSNTRQLALAMEMFETDVQPIIDDYLDGHIREKDFLMDARPWNNYAEDYRPLVEFAKTHGLRVLASNAPRRYVSLLGRGGGQHSLAALSPASRALLPPLPVPDPSDAYREIFMGHMAPAMRQRDATRPLDSVWALAADGKSYEVEAIVAQREGPKGEEYLIKWLGFAEDENSWHQPDVLQGDFQRLLTGSPSIGDSPAVQNLDSASSSIETKASADEGACPYIGFNHTKLVAMLEAQCLWDATMAWTLAKFYDNTLANDARDSEATASSSAAKAAAGIVLHINGSFHSRGRHGIPERLAQYCAASDRPGSRAVPRCLVVTCASSADVSNFPAHLAAFASTGGTGDDFVVLTDGMVSPSFEIEHPV
jgi:uncharacterized iron-regulated protein